MTSKTVIRSISVLLRLPAVDDLPAGDTSYNGQYGNVPPERGTLFRPGVYKREGNLRAKIKKIEKGRKNCHLVPC